jgi:U3 small nucleolar RNA-associated protein 14
LALLVISKERSSSNVLGRAILKVLWSTGYRDEGCRCNEDADLEAGDEDDTSVESENTSDGEEVEVVSGSVVEEGEVEDVDAEAERGAAGAGGWFSMTSFFRPRLFERVYVGNALCHL